MILHQQLNATATCRSPISRVVTVAEDEIHTRITNIREIFAINGRSPPGSLPKHQQVQPMG